MRPSKPVPPRGPLFGRPAPNTEQPASAAKSTVAVTPGPQTSSGALANGMEASAHMSPGRAPPPSSIPRGPAAAPGSLSNGFGNLSLHKAPQQLPFPQQPATSQQSASMSQPTPRFAQPPVGGGEYVQQHQQPPAQPQPSIPMSGPPNIPNRPAFPQAGPRGPPAFGKASTGVPGRPAPGPPGTAPGAFGRPPSPGSPSSLYAIPIPGSPTPGTPGRPLPPVQQPSAPQMPPRGLAPPSFTKPQQVCFHVQRKAQTV